MNKRKSLPAELKRAVLVEAGHRCAIHTCKQTTTEIHHIVPYEKCLKHEFKNLIVLCPNCHTRVHKGEIDRKSLMFYKEYLKSNDAKNSIVTLFSNEIDNENYELKESTKAYDFLYFIPLFKDVEFEELNIIMKYQAIQMLHWSRASFYEEDCIGELKNEFNGSFEITYINEKFISLECSEYIYSGGAHGNTNITTLNYQLNPIQELTLEDLFIEDSNYLEFLSKYCREYLEKTFSEDADIDWIKDGTKDKKDNFLSFTLTDLGIKFIFNQYQVACFAAGVSYVLIPYEHIGNLFNQEVLS